MFSYRFGARVAHTLSNSVQQRIPLNQVSGVRRMSAASSSGFNNVRLGLCQLKVGMNKSENLRNAVDAITQAKEQGADVVVLPVKYIL